MKRRFFIYSLPRSGSAWLSEFLSQPGSYCYHDPSADGNWDDLLVRWQNRPENCVGAVDTSAHQRLPLNLGPCTKYVLLRDPADISRSLSRLGYSIQLELEVERIKFATRECFPIYYSKLHDMAYLDDLWEMVTNTCMDWERAERLVEMNIQRSIAAVEARARARL